MMRRVLLAAVCVAATVTAVPSYADGPSCVSFTDPVGDGAISDSDVPASVPAPDSALDIKAVKYASTAKALVATLSLVAPKADHPTFAPGSRAQLQFEVDGKSVVAYYKYSGTREAEANLYYQAGIRVDGVFSPAAVIGELKGSDVVMTIRYTEFKAAGAAIAGKKLTKLEGHMLGSYVGASLNWDTAAAPASKSFTPGSVCT